MGTLNRFITRRVDLLLYDNEVRENIAEMLEELTYDVKVELTFQPLTGQGLQGNLSDEARSDVTAREFLGRGQITFFDCGIFVPSKTLRK